MDHHMSSILVRNDSSKVAQIPQNYRLEAMTEMFKENYFYAEHDWEYATFSPRQSAPLFDQMVILSGVDPALETR